MKSFYKKLLYKIDSNVKGKIFYLFIAVILIILITVCSFFKKLFDNKDSSVNSKIFYSFIAIVLIVVLTIGSMFGITFQLEMYISLLSFILALNGINSIFNKKE